ncbi:hypothetical protein, partial [Klebsiella pneumoniae]|uniref:hypothetical protein n=1 Tax=Klebsiella pneumoniae TaxID=573 RepID=UPI001D0E8875
EDVLADEKTIFSSDSGFSGTKDFALRQGGKRRDGRSIHKYVTDTRESSQRSMSAKDTGRAQRICLAA